MPGSLDRPDAMSYSQRVVRELKSDAPGSMANGRREVKAYAEHMSRVTGEIWTGVLDVYRKYGTSE
jgi:hypothetical protein